MRKARSTANGVDRTDAQDTIATSTSASRNPTTGDSTMASNVFDRPPQTAAESPAFAMPAPTNPPIKACELLEGIPSPQVMRFQTMAPIRAPKITCESITLGSMIPVPMVLATFSPNTAKATKLKNAAHATAYCGRSTRVETIVAIELAASFMPLRKSNASATTINANRNGKVSAAASIVVRPRSGFLHVLDDDAVHDVGNVIEAVHDFFQVVVD